MPSNSRIRSNTGRRNTLSGHPVFDRAARTLAFAHPGMRIDLGGFAKGHAVDNAVAILARLGIAHAFVSAGGDSRVIGDRRGRPWTLGVRHPRQADGVVALLPLIDTAVSTSGDYERFFEVDGVRHHHIIDPATGRSPHALHSVTILAADGLTAEAMSKTLFVLGLDRGLALTNHRPASTPSSSTPKADCTTRPACRTTVPQRTTGARSLSSTAKAVQGVP